MINTQYVGNHEGSDYMKPDELTDFQLLKALAIEEEVIAGAVARKKELLDIVRSRKPIYDQKCKEEGK